MPVEYLRETYRILEATDRDEFEDLQQQQDLYWSILGLGVVDFREGSMAQTMLFELFGEGTTTRANLEALGKPDDLPSP